MRASLSGTLAIHKMGLKILLPCIVISWEPDFSRDISEKISSMKIEQISHAYADQIKNAPSKFG